MRDQRVGLTNTNAKQLRRPLQYCWGSSCLPSAAGESWRFCIAMSTRWRRLRTRPRIFPAAFASRCHKPERGQQPKTGWHTTARTYVATDDLLHGPASLSLILGGPLFELLLWANVSHHALNSCTYRLEPSSDSAAQMTTSAGNLSFLGHSPLFCCSPDDVERTRQNAIKVLDAFGANAKYSYRSCTARWFRAETQNVKSADAAIRLVHCQKQPTQLLALGFSVKDQ